MARDAKSKKDVSMNYLKAYTACLNFGTKTGPKTGPKPYFSIDSPPRRLKLLPRLRTSRKRALPKMGRLRGPAKLRWVDDVWGISIQRKSVTVTPSGMAKYFHCKLMAYT